MPSVSKKQQQFMGAELARKQAGKSTKTNMSADQLEDYASTSRKGLPSRAKGEKNQQVKVTAVRKKKGY